jgi:hypothetical protein
MSRRLTLGKAMEANRLVLAGSFCWNKDRSEYGIMGHGNISSDGNDSYPEDSSFSKDEGMFKASCA